jgi:membrane protease YdiL (CAAX protease family)
MNLIENGSNRNVQRIFLPSKAIELLCKAIYYLVFISFIEEVIFRGILTELINKVSNNAIINVITIAFMFGIMHLPFYILQKIGLMNCTIKIIIAMIMHILFWFLRKKCKGNIYGCILAHALIDFAGNIV